MLRYAHSCCVADLTITLHVALYDCRWFIFLPLTSVLRVFFFEVCTLDSISTFPAVVAQLSTGSALCSHSPMFPQPYVPTFLRIFYSLTILTIRPYVPTALCSHRSMFPDLF